MATATVDVRGPIPPTEAEIREAIVSLVGSDGSAEIDEPVDLYETFRVILDSDVALARAGWQAGFYPAIGHPGTLWADMKPSEYTELDEAVFVARTEAFRDYLVTVRERVIAATAAFAAAHPDIPRGHWPIERPAEPTRGDAPESIVAAASRVLGGR